MSYFDEEEQQGRRSNNASWESNNHDQNTKGLDKVLSMSVDELVDTALEEIQIRVDDQDSNSLKEDEKLAYLNDISLDLSEEPKSSTFLEKAVTWDGGYGTQKIYQDSELVEEQNTKKRTVDQMGIIEKAIFPNATTSISPSSTTIIVKMTTTQVSSLVGDKDDSETKSSFTTSKPRRNSDPTTAEEKNKAKRKVKKSIEKKLFPLLVMPRLPPSLKGLIKKSSTLSLISSSLSERQSFVGYGQSQPTKLCHICYENLLESAFPSDSSQCHNHQFCTECLSNYFSHELSRRITKFHCAGGGGCDFEFQEEFVLTLFSEENVKKYNKFKLLNSDENYRECPNATQSCGTMILGNPKYPNMECPKCGLSFCFIHSNAHPNITCLEYARRIAREAKEDNITIKRYTRPCPKCKVPIQKNGGCNHMTCYKCNYQFCWICMRKYTNNHYDTSSINGLLFGCPGGQFSRVAENNDIQCCGYFQCWCLSQFCYQGCLFHIMNTISRLTDYRFYISFGQILLYFMLFLITLPITLIFTIIPYFWKGFMAFPLWLADEGTDLNEIVNDYGFVPFFTTLFIMFNSEADDLPDNFYNYLVYRAVSNIMRVFLFISIITIYCSISLAWILSIGPALFVLSSFVIFLIRFCKRDSIPNPLEIPLTLLGLPLIFLGMLEDS